MLLDIFFMIPLIVKDVFIQKNQLVLSEENGVMKSDHGTTKEISSKVGIHFLSLGSSCSRESRIPCSADWVITIVEPMQNCKETLSRRKLNGRNKGNQSPVIV